MQDSGSLQESRRPQEPRWNTRAQISARTQRVHNPTRVWSLKVWQSQEEEDRRLPFPG
jgi:hypothetical protein